MILKDKTVLFLGSSVTYGSGAGGVSFADLMKEQCGICMIKEAVWGMLPKNNIARKMMTRLKVFAGAEHTHAAQKPVEIKL